MSDVRVALRTAIVSLLEAGLQDPYDPYNVLTVAYRPTRAPIQLPAVTIFDTAVHIDSIVPLYARTLQIDIWTASDLDLAEAIAQKINRLLNLQPIPLPGGEGQVAFCVLQADSDLPQEDADLVRKMLTYRLSVYDYGDSQPFGG